MNMNKNKKASRLNSRSLILIISLVLVIGLAVSVTLAYIIDQTEEVENTFTPAENSIKIEETVPTPERNVKEHVKVKNESDFGVYVRAMIVVTWQNESGEVWNKTPVLDTDYTMSFDDNWTQQGNYYYYKGVVPANGETGDLIVEAKPIKNAPAAGYKLHIEILSASIQAEPAAAVNQSWGMTYDETNQTWAVYTPTTTE